MDGKEREGKVEIEKRQHKTQIRNEIERNGRGRK